MNDWQPSGYTDQRSPVDFSGADFSEAAQIRGPRVPDNQLRANLGGTLVDLRGFDDAVSEIMSASAHHGSKPLAVVSANLDHITHFGIGSRWAGTLEAATTLNWLTLLDGAPLRAKAEALTGQQWPRLAGSDMINPLLDQAESRGLRVGFLGGSQQTQEMLKQELLARRPGLRVSGWWAPERAELADHGSSLQLAAKVAGSDTDVLIVGLGKPRQELWIAEYGALTGARVLLAFGAVVDFLAGRIRRAPRWVSDHGLEWAWRLSLEPKRLAHRYLVDGPEAALTLKHHSHLHPSPNHAGSVPAAGYARFAAAAPEDVKPGADVVAIIVTHNNAHDIAPLMNQLRAEAATQNMRIVVADNSSSDGTWQALQGYPDVTRIQSGSNSGQAGGVNCAMKHAGPAANYLILNPTVRLEPGSILALRQRMQRSGAGIAVPQILDEEGKLNKSIRREPGLFRAIGDAFFGSYLPQRPHWLSETDFVQDSYQYPHRVDWATTGAMLINAEAAALVGEWDEQLHDYAQWTDFFRRSRDLGVSVWYEPAARMLRTGTSPSTSSELPALMAISKVRYARKHCTRVQADLTLGVVAVAALARSYHPRHRAAAWALLSGKIG